MALKKLWGISSIRSCRPGRMALPMSRMKGGWPPAGKPMLRGEEFITPTTVFPGSRGFRCADMAMPMKPCSTAMRDQIPAEPMWKWWPVEQAPTPRDRVRSRTCSMPTRQAMYPRPPSPSTTVVAPSLEITRTSGSGLTRPSLRLCR